MLVPEQFLDLAQVRAGAEELRREHVPEGMRRDALPLRDAGGPGVAEEGLGHDRLRQPSALHADEKGRFRIVRPDLEVVEKERLQGGVDRHDPLTAALRPPHLQQPPFEVDVLQSSPSSSLRRSSA